MWKELLLSIHSFNFYVIAILALFFVAAIIATERFIMLQFVFNLDFNKFLHNLRKMISAEDIERAISYCKQTSKSSLPKIALKALEASENDPTTIRPTIEADTIEMLPELEKRISTLPALATIIMMLGLLGTIDGLWWSFHSLDVLDTAKKQATLANGIASSLNATALAIIASILVLFFFHFIKNFSIGIIEKLHYGITVVTYLIAPSEFAPAQFIQAPSHGVEKHPEPVRQEEVRDDQPKEERAANDDNFSDAAVEDIKDEEEII